MELINHRFSLSLPERIRAFFFGVYSIKMYQFDEGSDYEIKMKSKKSKKEASAK